MVWTLKCNSNAFPGSKFVETLHAALSEPNEQFCQLGLLKIPTRIDAIIFWNRFKFEASMNFKGVQTLWKKSDKFTKILSQLDLHKSEFS
jgi:hypothetical protein